MINIARLRLASLALATTSLVLGLAVAELWEGAVLVFILGIGAILALRRYSLQLGTPVFLLGAAGAAAGVFAQAQPVAMAMLVGFVAALAFWDLNAFYARLSGFESDEALLRLKKKHLRRLGPVLGLGLAAGLAGLGIRIQFSLGWALLLGAAVVVCLRLVLKAQKDQYK